VKITLAQLNPTIGDFQGNLKKMESVLLNAASKGAELALFTELFPSGYPPKDWLIKQAFLRDYEAAQKQILELSRQVPETAVLYGGVEHITQGTGKRLYNSALLVQNGKLLFTQRKTLLPTYDVFDEARYFQRANEIDVIEFGGERLGITICEDIWNEAETFRDRLYTLDPVEVLAGKNTTLIINISASPFGIGKETIRYNLLHNHARRHAVPFILVNQVGANDELICDGNSMVVDEKGRLRLMLPAFQEAVETIDTAQLPAARPFKAQGDVASVYNALILGLRDYAVKCGFASVILGLSGGIDSALTCCLAAAALGADKVEAVYMPSPYSSPESGEDAAALARNLGCHFRTIPIDTLLRAYLDELRPQFDGLKEDETEENIQARIRGNIIMALSNKFGHLPLSSGNKSELSVGYCTLYGDMSGGLSVLADVPKTLVYRLASYINRDGEVIPERILAKEPSAELKPGQKDTDSLPPYDILDTILQYYLEKGLSAGDIIAEGFDAETVNWVISAVRKNEYKRVQAAPGLKISARAFGSGRRIPIAARWRH